MPPAQGCGDRTRAAAQHPGPGAPRLAPLPSALASPDGSARSPFMSSEKDGCGGGRGPFPGGTGMRPQPPRPPLQGQAHPAFVFSRLGGGSKQSHSRQREGLRTPLPKLGSRVGFFQEGSWPRPPASSDHLLVFPGTFPNPGTCPPPRMPQSRFCQPLHGAADWPDLRPSAPATGKGGHCRRVPGPLGSTAGSARDGCGVPGASGRRRGCWLACLVFTLLPLSPCVHAWLARLPAMLGRLPAGCPTSSALAGPHQPLAPLAAALSSLVTACRPRSMRAPGRGGSHWPRSPWSLPMGAEAREGPCAVGAAVPPGVTAGRTFSADRAVGRCTPSPPPGHGHQPQMDRRAGRPQTAGTWPQASWRTGSGGTLGLVARTQHMPSRGDGGIEGCPSLLCLETAPAPPKSSHLPLPSSLRYLWTLLPVQESRPHRPWLGTSWQGVGSRQGPRAGPKWSLSFCAHSRDLL